MGGYGGGSARGFWVALGLGGYGGGSARGSWFALGLGGYGGGSARGSWFALGLGDYANGRGLPFYFLVLLSPLVGEGNFEYTERDWFARILFRNPKPRRRFIAVFASFHSIDHPSLFVRRRLWAALPLVGSLVWLFSSSLVTTQLLAAPPHEDIPQVKMINDSMAAQWADNSIKPSPIEEDSIWARRVFLDLVGRIPNLSELSEFLKDKEQGRRVRLVDRLLGDDYTEEFANHWAMIWSNILIGRSGGNANNSLINREGMAKYLRDSFARNKPYNQMVLELVTASGATKPGEPDFNGATNFLIEKVNADGRIDAEDGVQATAAASKIFLGLQVQCTQCHNHPFNQWKQQKFWEFNAFFRQARSLRRFTPGTRDVSYASLVDEDFPGESNRADDAEIFYQERNGLTKVAYPVFIDGTEIGHSGFVTQVNRREELGKLMMASEFLDKMIVTRMWSQFLGYGFTRPIDDLGPHNAPSNAELLEQLGQEVRKSSYDLRQLMRWIVLSMPYQLSSRIIDANRADDPTVGETPRFSHFYTRQMTAEQLYQSLVTIGGQARGSLEQQQVERDKWLRQFVVAFGTDEGDEATTFNGTIPQALMMFNGELVKRTTQLDAGSFLKTLAEANSKPADKVQILFAAGVARKARPEEINVASAVLKARNNKMDEMLQDMWWAVLNSNEFIIVH